MNSDLKAFIQSELASGVTVEEIRNDLTTNGWPIETVDKLLSEFEAPNGMEVVDKSFEGSDMGVKGRITTKYLVIGVLTAVVLVGIFLYYVPLNSLLGQNKQDVIAVTESESLLGQEASDVLVVGSGSFFPEQIGAFVKDRVVEMPESCKLLSEHSPLNMYLSESDPDVEVCMVRNYAYYQPTYQVSGNEDRIMVAERKITKGAAEYTQAERNMSMLTSSYNGYQVTRDGPEVSWLTVDVKNPAVITVTIQNNVTPEKTKDVIAELLDRNPPAAYNESEVSVPIDEVYFPERIDDYVFVSKTVTNECQEVCAKVSIAKYKSPKDVVEITFFAVYMNSAKVRRYAEQYSKDYSGEGVLVTGRVPGGEVSWRVSTGTEITIAQEKISSDIFNLEKYQKEFYETQIQPSTLAARDRGWPPVTKENVLVAYFLEKYPPIVSETIVSSGMQYVSNYDSGTSFVAEAENVPTPEKSNATELNNELIKSKISNLRAQAEISYNQNGWSYSEVCSTGETLLLLQDLHKMTFGTLESFTANSKPREVNVACLSSDAWYVIQVPLMVGQGGVFEYWCIDSSLADKQVAQLMSEDAKRCPK